MESPRLGVVIPTRNRLRHTQRAIQSVLDQSIHCDVIVVDDNSDDGSFPKLQQLFADKAIEFVVSDGQGAPVARNIGWRALDTDYVAFLDSDDLYDPEFAVQMLDAIDESATDIAICGMKILMETENNATLTLIEKEVRENHPSQVMNGPVLMQPLLARINLWDPLLINSCNAIYKRSLLPLFGGWDEGVTRGQDYQFTIAALATVDKAAVISSPLFYHVHHQASSIQNSTKSVLLLNTIRAELIALADRFDIVARHTKIRQQDLHDMLSIAWSYVSVISFEYGAYRLGVEAAEKAQFYGGGKVVAGPSIPRSLAGMIDMPGPIAGRMMLVGLFRKLRNMAKHEGHGA